MAERKVSLGYVWFSFEGRISRSTYWLWYFLPVLVISIAFSFVDAITGTFFYIAPEVPLGIINTAVSIILLWPMIAAGAKRLHDRDQSGWFQLIYLVPIVNLIWWFIFLGCLKGTDGANRFGPDPLATTSDWAPDAMAQSDA
ncbi:MAG: DUF805 domain-containing protein [Rhodospirillales bacterium]|nr:DUF805 domain-containing protein [Rhodospirillales bacterium]MDH3917685.1 DUF805 domain-containing protein [Rhodospirillales bacterium]MDH3967153.1 DUF805 domain-containing protein [Rhodospirillales bacterium]